MKVRFDRTMALVASLAVVACGSSSTGPGNGGPGGTMTASVTGASFNPPSTTVAASYANQVLTVQGSTTTSPITAITINVLNVTGKDTYQLNPNFTGTFGQVAITNGSAVQVWTTALSPGTGFITLTTLTSTRVAGSFTFTAQSASGGATGQKSVTSGTFDIPL